MFEFYTKISTLVLKLSYLYFEWKEWTFLLKNLLNWHCSVISLRKNVESQMCNHIIDQPEKHFVLNKFHWNNYFTKSIIFTHNFIIQI